jgi:cullin-associated NEDD8-dissociated protein 1
MTRCGDVIPKEQYVELIVGCRTLITDDDLQLLPLALNCVSTIVKRDHSFYTQVNNDITSNIYKLILSPLVQGSALEALVDYYVVMANANPQQSNELFDHLFTLCASQTRPTAVSVSKQVCSHSTIIDTR